MNRKFLCFVGIFALTLIVMPLRSEAAKTLVVPEKIDFAKGSEVTSAVKSKCKLQTKVPNFVRHYAKDQFSKITSSGKSGKGTYVLDMQMVDLEGRGGGAWSGHKQLTVSLTLKADGKTYKAKARRYSGGGAFGGYKGTCAILGRCAKAIGKDIALWLADPKDNARLGDF